MARTFHIRLIILFVIYETGVREQIGLVIGIGKRSGTQHNAVFPAKELVGSEHYVLGDIYGIDFGDGFGCLVKVALLYRYFTGFDFLSCDGKESVAKIKCSVAVSIALTGECALCYMLSTCLNKLGEHKESSAGFLDGFGDYGVIIPERDIEIVDRGESLDNIAMEGFDIAEVDVYRCIRYAVALERSELRIA